MIDDESKAWLAGLASIGTVLGAFWARSGIKRRFSRDRAEFAHDVAEVGLWDRYEKRVAELESENRALRDENRQLGGLQTEVRLLREHIQRLEAQIAELMQRGHATGG